MNEILQALLKPENRILLWVLLSVATLIVLYLMYLTKVGALKWKFPFVESVQRDAELDATSEQGPGPRRYRKILYVKVVCLTDRSSGKAPVYHRTVERLDETERQVPVFDEAVYYTLELFPRKGPVPPRKERSSGVVDPGMVIPWRDRIEFRDAGASRIKEFVQLECDEPTDTFLSVSHFENGLQGSTLQDIGTDVPEDAEYVRLIVDFSSVPYASRFISAAGAAMRLKGLDTVVPLAPHGPGVFTVMCKDAPKGAVIKIDFRFDWERAKSS